MKHIGRTFLTRCVSALLALLLSLPLTAKAAPPLSVYGNLPGFEMAALSPSGDRIALIGNVDNKRQLLVVTAENVAVFASPVGDVKVRGLYWADENNILLQISQTLDLGLGFTARRGEVYNMLVWPLQGGKPWWIFGDKRKVVGGIKGFYGVRQRDGRSYGYFGAMALERIGASAADDLHSSNPFLYEVDFAAQSYKQIAERADGEGDQKSWLIGPDGKVEATLQTLGKSGAWSIKNRDGKKIAEGENKLSALSLLGYGVSTDKIRYEEEDEATSRSQFFEVPLAGGTITPSPDDNWGTRLYDSKTLQMMGGRKEGANAEYVFFDPMHTKIFAATRRAFNGLAVELIDWNEAFDRLLVTTHGTGDPGTYWFVDIKTGSAITLGMNYPIAAKDVAPVNTVKYKASDGLEIVAILTLPPGREPRNLPVVVLPHGGPASHDDPEFDWWAQAFASRGYAVLQPNFRGSTGYGAEFTRAGDREWGQKMQTDISDGLAELGRLGIADTKRACIVGASYGGYAALAGVTLQQGLYRCAVSVAGISDVAKYRLKVMDVSASNPVTRRYFERNLGPINSLVSVSPINFAANANAPILLIHGKDDLVVAYEQSTDMQRALAAAGKPVEFVTLPGEDHWLSKSETRLKMLESSLDFVQRHNPPDPTK